LQVVFDEGGHVLFQFGTVQDLNVLSVRLSAIYNEIIMTYPIHGWSPLCPTSCFINNRKSVTYFTVPLGTFPNTPHFHIWRPSR